MPRSLGFAAIVSLVASGNAIADVPSVVVDIGPVQSLVAQVMDGVGSPKMILGPGASPHDYALRPSDAAALQDADVVFWIGPALTPWLEAPINTLAVDAETVSLLEIPDTIIRPFRTGATFEQHDDAHAHDQGDGHDEAAEGADPHLADTDADPHAWLDPENGKVWLSAIAAALARLDPANADTYAANAEAGRVAIDDAGREADGLLAPVRDLRFIVFHDAYQYFEARFDVPAVGAISMGDAAAPGAARIEEVRDVVRALEVTCVFTEPQFSAGLVEAVLDGLPAQRGVIDPLGTTIPPGPGYYPELIRSVAREIAGCR